MVYRYTITSFRPIKLSKKDSRISFAIFGEEYTKTTHRLHWQGYIECPKKLTRWKIWSILKAKCHIQVAKKDPLNNVIYCMKEGNVTTLHGNHSCLLVQQLVSLLTQTSKLSKTTVSQTSCPKLVVLEEVSSPRKDLVVLDVKLPNPKEELERTKLVVDVIKV